MLEIRMLGLGSLGFGCFPILYFLSPNPLGPFMLRTWILS